MDFIYEDKEYRSLVLCMSCDHIDVINLLYYIGIIIKKYRDLEGELHLIEIVRKDCSSLGISLVGNKDVSKMSIFVTAMKEGYPAANSGQIFLGDQLLEVNGVSLLGRSHLNATPIFNSLTSKKVTILLLRSKGYFNHIAVLPQFRGPGVSSQNQGTITFIDKKFASSLEARSAGNKNITCIFQDDSDNFDGLDDVLHYANHSLISCPEIISSRSQSDLGLCPIAAGKVTKIEIKKGNFPFGCRVVGGIDMSLRRILVFEIFDGGAAAIDGRLRVADEILEIDGQDVHHLTHTEVVTSLKKVSSLIRLLIARDSTCVGEHNHTWIKEKYFSCKEFSIELEKKPGRSLGISVTPIWKDKGVLVADVIKSDRSEDLNNILIGDEIVAVNGMPLEHLATVDALLILKTAVGKIFMEVHRANVGLLSIASNNDLSLPYYGFFNFGSTPDLKKSRNIIRRVFPSCFVDGKKY